MSKQLLPAARIARIVRAALEVTRELAELDGTWECPLCHVGGTHDPECLVRQAAEAQPLPGDKELGELNDLFWVWLVAADSGERIAEDEDPLARRISSVLWGEAGDDGADLGDARLDAVAALIREHRDTQPPPSSDEPAAGVADVALIG